MGILGDGERKSTEPIEARACPNPKQVNNVHSKLLYFVAHSRWDDQAVRLEAAKYALEAKQNRGAVTPWNIDDTEFFKQGTHSVGVQRQYAVSAGKIANCKIGVSLCAATKHDHIPLDFEPYQPQPWIDDLARRGEARIPNDAIFQTEVESSTANSDWTNSKDAPFLDGIITSPSSCVATPSRSSSALALSPLGHPERSRQSDPRRGRIDTMLIPLSPSDSPLRTTLFVGSRVAPSATSRTTSQTTSLTRSQSSRDESLWQ